jgi:hypothetical protein
MSTWDKTKAEPARRLLELILMRLVSEAVHVAAALGISRLLADGPRTIDELARASGANAASLGRVLRALKIFDVYAEDDVGRFALTPVGDLLREDTAGSLNPSALFFGGEWGSQVDRLFLHCVRTGQSAGQSLCGNSWIDWLQSEPALNKVFNDMMTSYSTLHFTGVLEAYDFSVFRRIVDVGGGHGRILSEILQAHPQVKGILFDLPHAFEGGSQTIAAAGLSSRCEIVSGDFFVEVPVGADAYLFSRVIHDWADEQSIALLRVVRNAIAPQGRLILLEAMLRPDTACIYPVLSDLNMLVRTGGCERTEQQYRILYRAAGFELTRCITTAAPTGTTVIEGRPL